MIDLILDFGVGPGADSEISVSGGRPPPMSPFPSPLFPSTSLSPFPQK